MTAAAVFVAYRLDWWPQFLATARALGCATEPILNGEVVIFTGRAVDGAWVVG